VGHESIILGHLLQPFLPNRAQHQHWVVPGGLPQIAIEPAEQLDRLVVPGPPQIVGQIPEPLQSCWQ
jgi:hypothetical protein